MKELWNIKKKLENGADLYTYPINLGYGNYSITVTGDGCNIKRDFVIGNEYAGQINYLFSF